MERRGIGLERSEGRREMGWGGGSGGGGEKGRSLGGRKVVEKRRGLERRERGYGWREIGCRGNGEGLGKMREEREGGSGLERKEKSWKEALHRVIGRKERDWEVVGNEWLRRERS